MPFLELTERFLASENLVDALRRIEDQTVKVDLDKSFFEDLKEWYEAFEKIAFIEDGGLNKTELIVFASTLLFLSRRSKILDW